MIAFTFLTGKVSGQGCDCPLPTACAPCVGGLSGMTLRYNGAIAVAITVSDQGGIVYTGALITSGTEFSFVGSNPLDKFLGPDITVTVNALPNATIGTQCNDGVEVGNTYGSFTVISLVSKTGGTMCCPPAITDTTPPVISGCPTNINQFADGTCTAFIIWLPPTATDDCALESLVSSHSTGIFPIGVTSVTYTATDVHGNIASCGFTVTVTDNTPPVIASCPSNINLFAAANCRAVATWTAPTATDNCSVASLTGSHTSGQEFNLGSTMVTYTATDAAGNLSTCSFVVSVTDNLPPVISNCPVDITSPAAANCKAIVSWSPPTASDNCTLASLTSSHNPGFEFDLGTTRVTYTAQDNAGNVVSCGFNVTVTANQSITVSDCPAAIEVFADETNTAEVQWTEPSFAVACGNLTIQSSANPGSRFSLGENNVRYLATDPLGNTVECIFTVTVLLKDLEINLSQIVTPDGDGYNDSWQIENINELPDNEVIIYDRWGGQVFKTRAYHNDTNAWDGTRSGNILPTGTYFYYLKVKYGDRTVKKEGFIELVR
jgi:gliding motility-associated-like protein